LAFLATANVGATANIDAVYEKVGLSFNGASFSIEVTNTDVSSGVAFTGATSGASIHYSGVGYSDVENKVVSLLRSRASVDGQQTIDFNVTGLTDIGFDYSIDSAVNDAKGDFSITGVSTVEGAFEYSLSFDRSKKNYISSVLGVSNDDGKTNLFVEETFEAMFEDYYSADKIKGIKIDALNGYTDFDDYLTEYQPAVTPWVVSELRGTNLLRLFRLWTISDGNSANKQFKISIKNIRLDEREFDVEVRAWNDTDAKPFVLEVFTRCTMDPSSQNFIGARIGTVSQEFASRSNYILVELEEDSDTSDTFPAGFLGFPVRDYQSGNDVTVQTPTIDYKQVYTEFENKRKFYLGLSNTVGIDWDFFNYKGVPDGENNMWTGLTSGFHMDIDATGATIDNVKIVVNNTGGTYTPVYLFDTGDAEFRTSKGVQGTPYDKIYSRKFTFAPYGGFDGWDIHRTKRTNGDNFIINGTQGSEGLQNGLFTNRVQPNGDNGINSDYYAYQEAILTFTNPEATNINVLATPGIDVFNNSNLVEGTIEMVEQDRADSVYIVTTPDIDASGDVLTPDSIVEQLEGYFDSNYTATYWPWIQVKDSENNVFIYMPPTRDVVRNIALTDNIAQPWYAVAGMQRGNVDCLKARIKLTQPMRDTLYEGRVNPINSFATEGVKIWGNKTLQIKESALDRLNVRRLLLQARKLISAVSVRLLFEQNDDIVRNQFLSLVNPILDNIRSERGLTDFRVTLDDSPELIDQNTLAGKIYLKPTRSLEFISIEFTVMNTGASFDDI